MKSVKLMSVVGLCAVVVAGCADVTEPSGLAPDAGAALAAEAVPMSESETGRYLVDVKGRLIGINGRGSFEKRGRVNVGGFIANIRNFLKDFF